MQTPGLVQILIALAALAMQSAAEAQVRIELQSPLDFQVVQRSTREKGTVAVAGNVVVEGKEIPAPDALEVLVTGKSPFGEIKERWRPVAFDPRVSGFRSEIILPAGGWYRLQIRVLRHNTPVATLQVEHIGVGEVFVISGQSNSANYGEERQKPRSVLVSTFDGTFWRIADDPQPGAGGSGGSFIPSFGDEISRRFLVPVGIVATGVGGSSAREWLPEGTPISSLPTVTHNVVTTGADQWVSSGKIFTNFVRRMKELGPSGFRAVLWHQGESDANQADPQRTLPGALYRRDMEQLIRDSRKAIGWDAPWFVAQVSYHNPRDTASPEIRAAQKALWDSGIAVEGPDTDRLTGPMREKEGQGIHLSAKGLSEHGRMWAEKVSPWLERQLGGPR